MPLRCSKVDYTLVEAVMTNAKQIYTKHVCDIGDLGSEAPKQLVNQNGTSSTFKTFMLQF